ncbi:hypothetical protein FSARC_3358 [Fusarium sarcochroum]|uniref:Mitochondrial intermembrane space import and assembly protein 40 n=1 Tax=Fusarium sarcochroum TaxID=1208366 RepID=A0A8H4U496_9HYPO|nr:hypothetical protein FSARC_3358 [Fusarium sarcochroum]
MLRTSLRSAARHLVASSSPIPARRLASTATRHGARSWQRSAVGLGFSISMVAYFNTGSVFAESLSQSNPAPALSDDDRFPTESSLESQKQSQESNTMPISKNREPIGPHKSPVNAQDTMVEDDRRAPEEKDTSQKGAYDPETGEFNWDCPCLGGMAHGPCGEEFKVAFRCFTLSTEEPRGIECIEKFQHMQTCFKRHPDVYGGELTDEDEDSSSFSHGNGETEANASNGHERTHEIASIEPKGVADSPQSAQKGEAAGDNVGAGKP